MNQKMELRRVKYIPPQLERGVLYVSQEFGAAAHLCACGCGAKVRTPLTPTDWSLEVAEAGPTLSPSVGNWQLPCRSHYWIVEGKVVWEGPWSTNEIEAGRLREQDRRAVFYGRATGSSPGWLRKFLEFLKHW